MMLRFALIATSVLAASCATEPLRSPLSGAWVGVDTAGVRFQVDMVEDAGCAVVALTRPDEPSVSWEVPVRGSAAGDSVSFDVPAGHVGLAWSFRGRFVRPDSLVGVSALSGSPQAPLSLARGAIAPGC